MAVGVLSGLVGSYFITSFILFRYPQLVHRVKKRFFIACHISHRGGAGERLENTMEAFRNAAAQNTDMFELDCQLTRDGQVVVSHDPDLKRSCDVDGLIHEFDFHELPLLSSIIEVGFDPGVSCMSNQDDRQFLLLESLFSEFPRMPMNIDIKTNSDELIEKVDELIKKYRRENITVWGNFSHAICEKCYRQNPNISLVFSMKKALIVLACYVTGLLPFIPLKEGFFEMPMLGIIKDPKFRNHPLMQKTSTKLILKIAAFILLRPSLVNHLRKRGIPTYYWVVNSKECIRQSFELGAEGVMTDYPTRLAEFLHKHPEIRDKRKLANSL